MSTSPVSGSTDIHKLARDFVDATIYKIGTDEEVVYEVLKAVHDTEQESQFFIEVRNLLTHSKNDLGWGNTLNNILHSEMSGSQLCRAVDLYKYGEEQYRADEAAYLFEGAISSFDLSSTESKIACVGGMLVFGVGAVASPFIASAGGVLLAAGIIYGAATMIKNVMEIASSNSNGEAKQNIRELGTGLAITTASLAGTGLRRIGSFVSEQSTLHVSNKALIWPEITWGLGSIWSQFADKN